MKTLPQRPVRLPSARRAAADWHPMLGRAAIKRWLNIAVVASCVIVDATMIVAAFYTAYQLRATIDIFSTFVVPDNATYGVMLVVLLVVLLLTFNISGLYSLKRGVSKIDRVYRISSAVSIGLVFSLAVNSLLLGDAFLYSRQILLIGWVLCIGLVTAGRFVQEELVGLLRSREAARDRLLIVGAGKTGRLVLETIQRSPSLGYEVVGFLTHVPDSAGAAGRDEPREIAGVPVLGDDRQLADLTREHTIDEVIVALTGTPHEEVLALAQQVIDQPVNIKIYPDTFQLITNNELSLDDLGGLPMVSVRNVALRGWNRVLKRIIDVVFSALILTLISPLLLALALLVKLTSPGPVFYVQARVGRDGRPFLCLKLRSMRVQAEDETGPIWAIPNDARRTPLGRFMRRYSLDELPQFINVLLGEMSIVGPRPERPHFVERFSQSIPKYQYRHHEKAGITGWAQVNGLRGDTSIEERTRYDLYYIENWSPLFDIKIIIKTAWIVLRPDKNAY